MTLDKRVERTLSRVHDDIRDAVAYLGEPVEIHNRTIDDYDPEYDYPEFRDDDDSPVETSALVSRSVTQETFERSDVGVLSDAEAVFLVSDETAVYDGSEGDDPDTGNERAPSRVTYDGKTYDVVDVYDRGDGVLEVRCDE